MGLHQSSVHPPVPDKVVGRGREVGLHVDAAQVVHHLRGGEGLMGESGAARVTDLQWRKKGGSWHLFIFLIFTKA